MCKQLDARRAVKAEALNRLALIEDELTAAAVASTEGDATAFRTYANLTAEANKHRQMADIFTRALEAFDRARAEAKEAKFKERQAAANERRKLNLDAQEREQRRYIEAHIERLVASGQKREAETWRNELKKLRQTLEQAMPPVGQKPTGPSHVIGVTNLE